MNGSLKRLLALTGSAIIGFLGALVFASPAQAHDVQITGVARCTASGEYAIDWSIYSGNWRNRYAKLENFSSNPTEKAVRGLGDGTIIAAGTAVHGTQLVPGSTTSATISVVAKWYNPITHQYTDNYDSRTGSATFADGSPLNGQCRPQPTCVSAADARFQHTFDGPNGKATVELKGQLPLCEGQQQDFLLVSYYAPGASFATPQYEFDHQVGTISPNKTKIELDVELPPCWTQVDLVWGGESALIDPLTASGARYGDKKLGSAGAPGNKSRGPNGWYNGAGTEGRQCTTPKATFVSKCDGTVEVHLANDGQYEATFTVKAGDFSRQVKVAAGKASKVEVPAGKGKITVTEQGQEIETYTWERPEDCPVPSMSVASTCDAFTITVTNPQGGTATSAKATYGDQVKTVALPAGKTETITFVATTEKTAKVTFTGLGLELVGLHEKPVACGELPKTGDNTAGYIASGTGLVALGAVVFFFARRRMVNLRRMAS